MGWSGEKSFQPLRNRHSIVLVTVYKNPRGSQSALSDKTTDDLCGCGAWRGARRGCAGSAVPACHVLIHRQGEGEKRISLLVSNFSVLAPAGNLKCRARAGQIYGQKWLLSTMVNTWVSSTILLHVRIMYIQAGVPYVLRVLA